MKKPRLWVEILVAAGLLSGCCSNPGVFQKVSDSLHTVQAFYDPLLKEDLNNEKVRRAVVAADTALLVAAELQKQWCPEPKAVEQLQLQVKEVLALQEQVRTPAQPDKEK